MLQQSFWWVTSSSTVSQRRSWLAHPSVSQRLFHLLSEPRWIRKVLRSPFVLRKENQERQSVKYHPNSRESNRCCWNTYIYLINTSLVHQMRNPFTWKEQLNQCFTHLICFQSRRLTTLPHHLVGFRFNFLVFGKVSSGSFEVFFLHWRTLLFHRGWLRNRPTHQYFVFKAQGTKLPPPKGYNIQSC